MKHLILRTLPLLLLLCLLAALWGCGGPGPGPAVSTAAAPTEPPLPQPSDTRVELDGAVIGPLFRLGDESYLEARALSAALALPLSETEDSLRLGEGAAALTLREGVSSAEMADGGRIALSAAPLRGPEGWYLPVSAPQALWGRTPVPDEAENALRFYTAEEGPALLYNGLSLDLPCRLLGGVPVCSAAELAERLCDSAEQGQENGVPLLTLRAGEHSLRFRSGSLRAELDGQALTLPVPAWQDGETLYLPAAAAAEALGCTAFSDEAGRLCLLKAEEGPRCWFGGTGLGPVPRVDGSLCGGLSALAAALGGSLSRTEDALTLEALDHSLVLHPGETRAELDGEALELPLPVFSDGTDWLIPLEEAARAFGLKALSDREEGIVYSRLEPRETLVWINGCQAESYTLPEGGLYVALSAVAEAAEGSFVPEEEAAVLTAWGREYRLRGGASELETDGEPVTLSAPVLADGALWYAPASELLPALGLTELEDPELDQRYYTHIVRNDAIPEGYRVPVLMYHAVSDYMWGIPELFASPSKLEEQLQAMLEAGYTAITFEDLDRIDQIEKPVLLTFDDGYDDNYTELFPLLKKYNVKATIFVIVNDLGKIHKLTRDQVRELSDSGLVSIQSHTMSHNYLDGMYEKQLRYEHYDSMLALARITGKQPFVMCYPTGKNSAFSRSITAEYYQFGLNMGGPCYVTGDPPYRIYRYYISRYTSVETFLEDLEGKR